MHSTIRFFKSTPTNRPLDKVECETPMQLCSGELRIRNRKLMKLKGIYREHKGFDFEATAAAAVYCIQPRPHVLWQIILFVDRLPIMNNSNITHALFIV